MLHKPVRELVDLVETAEQALEWCRQGGALPSCGRDEGASALGMALEAAVWGAAYASLALVALHRGGCAGLRVAAACPMLDKT